MTRHILSGSNSAVFIFAAIFSEGKEIAPRGAPRSNFFSFKIRPYFEPASLAILREVNGNSQQSFPLVNIVGKMTRSHAP